jgi:hypothetical protein
MNVNGSILQKAFAVSSNAADSRITPERERVLFRKISRLIWDACREDWQAETAAGKEMTNNGTAAPGDAPVAALVQTNQSGNHSHVNQSIALMPVMDRPVVEKRDRE